MEKHRYTLSSTHLDSQGFQMTKEALLDMSHQVNGSRKPRLGLEHIRTFPPFGVIMNGEVVKASESEHYLLTADMVYFDKRTHVDLNDDDEYVREYFSTGEYPFIECAKSEAQSISISTDPSNFSSFNEVNSIYKMASLSSGLEINGQFHGRKSELPDPETIITITQTIAVALGIVKSKITEKLGEAIGNDLAQFYKLVTSIAIETLKRAIPKNREQCFVIDFPNSNGHIELVVCTKKVDVVLESLEKNRLKVVKEKVKQLKRLNPEKIQFIFNENNEWEFNYLLSSDGSVVGKLKSFKARNELYQKILKQQDKTK